jgi:mediator of RNA polymerase II transcription subunit 6
LEYFSERSNPFYDRTCNNEILKMQRLPIEQLRYAIHTTLATTTDAVTNCVIVRTGSKFQGIEYILLHCQEPILYVIRKQDRLTPTQATPIADYYIIAGVVYQAPDLHSLINSRILSTVHHLSSAFDESYSYSRYHPSKGYWFEFSKDGDKDGNKEKSDKTSKEKNKEEMNSSTKFQRKRVDILLSELTKKFPPKLIQQTPQQPPPTGDKASANSSQNSTEAETKVEVKVEKAESTAAPSQTAPAPNARRMADTPGAGPPEKKQRLN